MDRNLPLAISVTPQAYNGAIARFVKKTCYDMTQFFGREFLPCVLPEVLSEADLISVARIHFPTIGNNALGYIANEARLSQNYLQAVEAIARRARFLAGKRGGAVTMNDVTTAVSDVLSRKPISSEQCIAGAQIDSEEAPNKVARKTTGRRVSEPLKPVPRSIQPSGMGANPEDAFDSGALLGTGTMRAEEDLVPMEA